MLDGGRTAHSALKLPLNIHTNPDAVCNIKKHSGMAKVLQKCKIIIWDECTMAHKHSLEALDRMMKDLNNNTRLFGGALLLLSGDFRQTLPVIPRATYADEINACIKQSYLWRNVTTLRLNKNIYVYNFKTIHWQYHSPSNSSTLEMEQYHCMETHNVSNCQKISATW